jgi:hypothetical protein
MTTFRVAKFWLCASIWMFGALVGFIAAVLINAWASP